MRRSLAVLVALAALATPRIAAQQPLELRVIGPAAVQVGSIPIGRQRGYAAVPMSGLEKLGWTVAPSSNGVSGGVTARREGDSIEVRERTPFFSWNGKVLQLPAEAYRVGEELWVPLALVSDFLPAHLPDEYAFVADGPALRAQHPKIDVAQVPVRAAPASAPQPVRAATPVVPVPPNTPGAKRVVVIDPGHGGDDPGARGPGGVREKDIALALGLALAHELEKRPDLEVHLTRSDDRLVPLWERGERATEIKGDRTGIFISIHLNAGSALDARGFETYFLSEARTEHERRVAALENEAFQVGKTSNGTEEKALTGILKDLSNLDQQHWSALLAEMVQQDLAPVHPGPNRGVKQGPLAVITNALMPAVLIEVGFISNRAESRLLSTPDFQESVARALARSVDRFFERYPPA